MPIFTGKPTVAVLAGILLASSFSAAQSVINLSSTNQTITGFGGMNFPRWGVDLTADQTTTAFGTGPGQLGLSMLRISAAPVQSDWSKELPTAKRAKALGATVFASPWSPPASMKSNNNLVDGSLNTGSYAAYAKHLTDFVNYMKDNGSELLAISIQNEPDIDVSYESALWSSTQITNFLKNNAGTIPTKVIAAESWHYAKNMTDGALNDAAAAANFEIVGIHLYAATPSAYPLAKTKGKELWMTEHYTTSDRSANLWPDALEVVKEIHGCMVSDFNAYIWWYIRRSYGLLTEDGLVSKRGYVMSQYSKFIRPGFVRVDVPASPQTGLLVSAYKKDGNVVVVAINSNTSAKTQAFTLSNPAVPVTSFKKYTTSSSKNAVEDGSVAVNNGAFSLTLEAQSISTLVFTSGTTGITDRPQSSMMELANQPGDYQVFDLAGTRLGLVKISEGQALRTEIRKLVLQSGFYLVKPVRGDASFRIDVGLR